MTDRPASAPERPWTRRPMRAAAALALVLAAACGGRKDDGVTLRFWAFGAEGEKVQALVTQFEREHPGVRVELQQIPWTAAHEKLLTAHVGGGTPDVAQLGNTWVPEFAALNALAPLDGRVAATPSMPKASYFPGIWDTNVIAGKAYGIPWYVDTRVLFYRTDLLRAAGYDSVPQTWEGWTEAMRRIKARMTPSQYPILLPTNEWTYPVAFGLQAGSPLLRDGGRFGGFEDPRFRRAFAFYVGLFEQKLAPSVANTQISNLYQEFERGNIAMYITGPWNIGEFTNRLPASMQDRWATAPLPGPTGPGVSLAGGASLVMFRASKHPAEAWALIEFLSRPANQLAFYHLTGDLPARREAWADTSLANNRHARAFRIQLERVVATPKVPEWEQIATKVADYSETAVRRTQTVDGALRSLDRDVDGLLEKRRWLLERGTVQALAAPGDDGLALASARTAPDPRPYLSAARTPVVGEGGHRVVAAANSSARPSAPATSPGATPAAEPRP
ncbi:MAG TPA: sugar ABC transporter substrate-binding protein [Longimicrobium sp.]|nr:sugar ABC transporter substrate-binding protein [Longimicrobium sp.]